LTTSNAYDYVKDFIGTPDQTVKGDWKSLHCSERFGNNTVALGIGIGLRGSSRSGNCADEHLP
jgi:hypothetical protein